jgi:hypothetical protein
LLNPITEILGRLVSGPARQNDRIVPVVGVAKLGYRASHHAAGGFRIIW